MGSMSPRSRTVRAVVLTGPNQLDVATIPAPTVPDEGGLGRVLSAGVCGSDLSLVRDGGLSGDRYPFVLGHETVVRIESASSTLETRWGAEVGGLSLIHI